MKLARFYCESITAGENTLCAEESHHLIHVSRLNAGDEIELFDGSGICAKATVTAIKRSEVVVQVAHVQTITRPRTKHITIAASIPKGKRFDW
ncbi:MAG: RsmE family RNA methyltransferase, partial [Planctomycetes bacterium]|nr:RsmE family RNA methyltransferase [Planctomycetota bacterium]